MMQSAPMQDAQWNTSKIPISWRVLAMALNSIPLTKEQCSKDLPPLHLTRSASAWIVLLVLLSLHPWARGDELAYLSWGLGTGVPFAYSSFRFSIHQLE